MGKPVEDVPQNFITYRPNNIRMWVHMLSITKLLSLGGGKAGDVPQNVIPYWYLLVNIFMH